MTAAAHTLAWIRFETPVYLLLLALLPVVVLLSFRSLAGLGGIRRAVAIGIRCAVLLVMILALAGLQRTQEVDELSVIFLLDRSRSIPESQQRAAFEFVKGAPAGRRPDDRLGVISFDGVASVEQLPMKTLTIDAPTASGQPDRTNLSSAARLGLALLPADAAGRLVLLSDGNENVGDVLDEAEQLRAAGVPIDVLPLDYEVRNEIVVEQLKTPPDAMLDETINLQMVLRAQQAARGRILLWHNDVPIDLDPNSASNGVAIELEPGPNRHVIPVPLRSGGVHRFRAMFEPEDGAADAFVENNSSESFTIVAGESRVLILTTVEDEASARPSGRIIADALLAEGLKCELEVAGAAPLDQIRLLDYSLVILANVPAAAFTDDERRTLAAYVRELGGGLVMVGGDDAFGAGGWQGTPVEDVLPVSCDVKQRREVLKGALVMVMHACEVPDGNYIGERAAIAAVNSLSARDLVGVLAYSWTGGAGKDWAVPLQEVGNRASAIMGIKKMNMGDLPDLHPPMQDGVEALLSRRDAGVRHMVVVSDFDPQPPREELLAQMRDAGITCSTIAIGYGGHFIDEQKATYIAQSTGGKFYRTNDYSKIPQIFVRESQIVRRSLIQEGRVEPKLVNPVSPLAAGLPGALPELRGFVLSTPKPASIVPIVRRTSDADDPILAHWQVGLGRTAAFTSGLWPRWGVEWVAWPGFSKFWAQIARWASRQSDSAGFDLTTTVQGGTTRVRIDAVDQSAAALNFLDLVGAVVTPGQQAVPLRLVQTGPGRYETEFDSRERGNYVINLAYASGAGAGAVRGSIRSGVTISYSPEFTRPRADLARLDAIREKTGGRALDAAAPTAVFDRAGLRTAERRFAAWENLLRWMLILFLLDVAVRRIAFHPVEFAYRVRKLIAELAGRRQAAEAAAAVLTNLKGARERLREARTAATDAGSEEAGASRARRKAKPAPEARVDEALAKALGGGPAPEKPVVAKPSPKKPPIDEAGYTSRLLQAKRRARGGEEADAGEDDKSGAGPGR